MRAVIGGVGALLAVVAAVLVVMVASAESDATPAPPVVLAPHGAEPTVYAGPGDRAQLNGLWRVRRDRDNTGLDKGFQTGKFGGELVRVPYVPDATKISGIRGISFFRGTVAWYRTKVDVPVDGTYAIRFESVNHRARVYLDGKLMAEHKGEYLPFDVRAFTEGRHAPQPRRARRLPRPDGDEARRLASPLVQLRRHQPRRQHPAHRRERALLPDDDHEARQRRGARQAAGAPAQQRRAAPDRRARAP